MLSACSVEQYENGRLGFPEAARPVSSKSRDVVRFMPWEVWPLGSDLTGAALKSPLLKQGDNALRAGQRGAALDQYYQAQHGPLAPAENEAMVMRIASTELALDQPNKALLTLSNYFRSSGKVVDDVSAIYSLVFAYSYARKGDMAQALAWFSRATRVAGTSEPGMRDTAEQGIRSALKTLSEAMLDGVSQQWANDTIIRSLAGEERARRFSGGSIESNAAFGPWTTSVSAAAVSAGGTTTIGVLLPLTGQFGNLGKSVKNGMDLALSGLQAESSQAPMKVSYRDASASPDEAVAQARGLVAEDGATVLVGPLLSEHAVAVGEFSRQSRVPLLALAKNSNFPTGESVFRLGATVESQIRSLMDACQNKLRLQRYALIYPDDNSGRELADAFRREIGVRSLSLMYETQYPRGNSDAFVSIAPALEATSVDAVFLADSVTMASRFFGTLSPAFRERITPIGAALWDAPTQLANSSAALEGAVFVSPFLAGSPRPAIVQFSQAYQSSYGAAPDFLAAQGFDALSLVAAAVRRQQSEGVSLPLAMQQVDLYDGLTGRITVRPDGEFDRQFSVAQLLHGTIQELPEPQTPSFVLHGNGEPEVRNNLAGPGLGSNRTQ